jgi:hypothetical protein
VHHFDMINLAKQMVLWSLERAGYRLLRKPDHEALLVAAAAPHNRPAPAAAPVAHSAGHGHPSATDLTAALASCDVTLAAFLTDAEDRHRLAPLRAFALYRIAQYLACAGIAGEVVDCGYGATAALAAIAAASVQCGDTSRRLVLFDSSADPLHRAETELDLWGTSRDLIAGKPTWSRPRQAEALPDELTASGYPADKIEIRRYPREPIAQTESVAFLGLTSESYPANREAIAAFLPKVSRGGVIAVEGNSCRDAVTEFLAREHLHLLFVQVAADYRIAVKP